MNSVLGLEGLEDETEGQPYDMQEMQVDAGTDAPKFLILNVVPGVPDIDLIKTLGEEVDYLPRDRQTRIAEIVKQLRKEHARAGVPTNDQDLEKLKETFALLKGKGEDNEILSIQKQSKVNCETYLAYK